MVALVVGTTAVVVGAGIGVPWLVKHGLSPMAAGGLVLLAIGLGFVVYGTRALALRATGWRRWTRAVGMALVVLVTTWTFVPAVMATNVPPIAPGDRTPAGVGLDAEDVELLKPDGVRLAAWYVPPADGAAVVLRHGSGSTRSSTLDQAAVLVRHGYGVLLTDARGHGDSEGTAMDFGWYGDLDLAGALDFLATRPEVDPQRLAVLGLSMGGEEAIGAAGTDPRIRAVVAEGATHRSAADLAWLSDEYGLRGWLQRGLNWAQTAVTDVLTDASRPPSLASVANAVAAVAPDRATSWVVEGAGHTGGLDAQPVAWEQRVVGFLDEALRRN